MTAAPTATIALLRFATGSDRDVNPEVDALGAPVWAGWEAGDVTYVTDVARLEVFDGHAWQPVGAGGTSGTGFDPVVHTLADVPLTAAMLRAMPIGATSAFPTVDKALSPGSTTTHKVSVTTSAGIVHPHHELVDAVLMRTGPVTWRVVAQEWTGTSVQPAEEWILDLSPDWSDHTGIGSHPPTSFQSPTLQLESEIGDASILGAGTLAQAIVDLRLAVDGVSKRVATLEQAGGSHQHIDVAADWTLHLTNQGPHYGIVEDIPGDHIGVDLFDGKAHKVDLALKSGFDPTNVEGANWVTGVKPAVWIQHASAFAHIVDAAQKVALSYQSIMRLIETHSILTVTWDTAAGALAVSKVEHGTTHTAAA